MAHLEWNNTRGASRDEQPVRLNPDGFIRFVSDEGDEIEVMVERDMLSIRSTHGALVIMPQVSNHINVKAAGFGAR